MFIKVLFRCFVLVAGLTFCQSINVHGAVPSPYFATLGSDHSTSYFFTVGKAIQNTVNEDRRTHNVFISCESTGGSRFNIIQTILGDHQFGISDSETLQEAYAGLIVYGTGNAKGIITSVLNVHPNGSTLFADIKVSDDVVYVLIQEVFDNFDEFINYDPSLKGLTREEMVAGLLPPIHPGAQKYFNDQGFSTVVPATPTTKDIVLGMQVLVGHAIPEGETLILDINNDNKIGLAEMISSLKDRAAP